jgi:hypothetical protein
MTWHWQYSTGDSSATFPSQAEAETWLGEVWRDLVAAGVTTVWLHEEGRIVYGPMSLRA